MNKELNVYADIKIDKFVLQLLSNYDLNFLKLSDLENENNLIKNGIVFIDQEKTIISNHIKKFINNLIILSKNESQQFENFENVILLKTPVSINMIRNKINSNLFNVKIEYKNISIIDNFLINKNNNNSCFLTSIETEILIFLVKNKECNKNEIKKNILNIKSTIETNSLESHLTRLRKKFEKIQLSYKIQSKKDILCLIIN